MKERKAILYPGGFYHVYNRANGDEVMFRSEQNYEYFLRQYDLYISPIAKTCAFCLMPNHFHFLVQIRSDLEIVRKLHNTRIMHKLLESSNDDYNLKMNQLISLQFSHLFNSYAQSYNKIHDRKGSLFIPNYNRVRIKNDLYFVEVIVYIHLNPVKSGITKRFEEWKFSSYNYFLSRDCGFVHTDLALDFFNDMDNFIFVHQKTLQGL